MRHTFSPITDSTVPLAVRVSRIFSGLLRMVLSVLGVTEEIHTL